MLQQSEQVTQTGHVGHVIGSGNLVQNHLYFHGNQACYHGKGTFKNCNADVAGSHFEGNMALSSHHGWFNGATPQSWGVEAYSAVPPTMGGRRHNIRR